MRAALDSNRQFYVLADRFKKASLPYQLMPAIGL